MIFLTTLDLTSCREQLPVKDQYLVRIESFGATVYHPETLSYFFINEQQLAHLAESCQLDTPAHVAQGPNEQLDDRPDWSKGQFDSLLAKEPEIKVRTTPLDPAAHTLAAPVRIYFELTTLCNAHCEYCLNNSGSQRPNSLDTNEILQTIHNLGRDGVFEVRLTGGEVTLLRDLERIAAEVRACGMALSINSNLMGAIRTIEQLQALRPNLLITSLDADQSAHGVARGRGYDKIVANIRHLRAAGVPLRLNCALGSNTLPYISGFIDRFAQLGCGFCFILIRPVGRATACFCPPPLSELMRSVELIDSKRMEYPDCYFSTSFHVVMEEEFIVNGINLTGCNAIQKSFNINSDGSVAPCAFLYELSHERFSLGNIRDTDYSILPIWRQSTLLRELRAKSAASNRRCIKCAHFKNDCLGSCVFMDLYSKHTGQPDPYCQISACALDTSADILDTKLENSDCDNCQ